MVTHVSVISQVEAPTPQEPLAREHFPGAASRSQMLFAHGFGQTRLAWKQAATRLAVQGFTGTTFDARGHGESRWNRPDEPYEMSQFTDDLARLARVQQSPPILVGASMGGLLGLFVQGQAMAQAQPPPFRALVLVDITPRWETRGVERILGFMTAHPLGFANLDEAADAIAAYLPHRSPRKSPETLQKLLVRGNDGRWRWHWDPRLIDSIGRRGEELQETLLDAARRITVPTLLISGGRSELVTEAQVEEFLELVPHAHHVCLPKATHMVVGDDNDAFTQTILGFIKALPSGQAHSEGGSS